MLTTSCREVHTLLGLFFDSELDSRQMRTVALHSATCTECENELRRLERLQDIVGRAINERVDAIDLSHVWTGIEGRLAPRRISWRRRASDWWSEREWSWSAPAFGAAAAAAAVLAAVSLWQSPVREKIETAFSESPVSVHEISSDSHVAMLSEADTLLLWVDHELDGDAGVATAEPLNFEEFE